MNSYLVEQLVIRGSSKIIIYGSKDKKTEKFQKDLENRKSIKCLTFELQSGFMEVIEKFRPNGIILMKQLITRQDIFLDLMNYCKKNKVFLLDWRGRDLLEVCCQAEVEAKTIKEFDRLVKCIREHDIISFDIFDTLLMRKVLLPEDVFSIVERRLEKRETPIKAFKQKRMKAQEELGLSNPDIYQIYERMQKKYRVSDEQIQQYMKMELQTEREVLVPREEMLELYRECLKAQKRVFLVTDMYLPESLLAPILKEQGITQYEKIYISCDRKQLKLQGLLETYKDETKGEKYLHIGDHLIHDGICAGLAGIDYCLIASGYKMAQSTIFEDSISKAQSLEEHIMMGLCISHVFRNPFLKVNNHKKLVLQKEYDYGYAICAPLIIKFALWIYETVRKEGVDDILFASRDGYLMQRLYDMIRRTVGSENMPQGIYFYTSRKAAVMTGINNEAMINMLIEISCGMPPQKIMRERFGLAGKDILPYDVKKYGDSIHKYVWDHVEEIFKRAEVARQNYYKYMGKIGLHIGRKYAFMDFVSSGTSQKSLDRMVPFELMGIYAGWNGTEETNGVHAKAMFEDQNTYFLRRYKIMETFMTSEEPSLSHFDEKGNPVFAYQDRNEKELTYVKCMQKACMDYMEHFFSVIMPANVDVISNQFVDAVYGAGANTIIEAEDAVLNHLSLMDDWRKKKNRVNRIVQ